MIYIGTAGFSYKDWIGPFYPEGLKDSDMLEYYSREFDFVEVNSSYYHMPSLKLFKSLDSKTPRDFRFAVKLFQGFTHTRISGQKEADNFLFSLDPVIESGKFLTMLVQFPYSFHCNDENREYLQQLRNWFGSIPLHLEFRNIEWMKKNVIEYLQNNSLGFVSIDQPPLRGLPGKVAACTNGISYIRFHGRNGTNWYEGEGSARYDYLYTRDELLGWMPKVKELAGSSGYTVISFNNHPIGKAVESARLMRELLKNMQKDLK